MRGFSPGVRPCFMSAEPITPAAMTPDPLAPSSGAPGADSGPAITPERLAAFDDDAIAELARRLDAYTAGMLCSCTPRERWAAVRYT
jgi:hypothetical protein